MDSELQQPQQPQQGTKRALDSDDTSAVEQQQPPAKRVAKEYYQYAVLGEEDDMHHVYLLDMGSEGAHEAHALLQKVLEYDNDADTIYTSRMIEAMSNGGVGYSAKRPFGAELAALKHMGTWKCHPLNSQEAQGHRGQVYYVFGHE